jgi:hypothetical protein
VLVPADAFSLATSQPSEYSTAGGSFSSAPDWLLPLLLVGVGIGGYQAAVGRKKCDQEEEDERQATIEALFGGGCDTPEALPEITPPMRTDRESDARRSIDALCDVLFNADSMAELLPPAHAGNAAAGSATVARDHATHGTTIRRTPMSPAHRPPTHKRPVRHRLSAVWLAVCLLLTACFGVRSSNAPRRAPSPPANEPSRAEIERSSRAIESIRVGQRVLGRNPELSEVEHSTATAVDPASWRLVRLRASERWRDGRLNTIEVQTLQPLSWIDENDARVGNRIAIPYDLAEIGLPEHLRAEVLSIGPCPVIDEGAGQVVLTTISHLNRHLFELTVADAGGRREVIRPTGFHKFYSVTRHDWIPAADLSRGEELSGIDGPITVATVARRPGTERVYNMTVEGEHVYHVSAAGVLVHNACPGSSPMPPLGNFGGNGANLATPQTQAQFLISPPRRPRRPLSCNRQYSSGIKRKPKPPPTSSLHGRTAT